MEVGKLCSVALECGRSITDLLKNGVINLSETDRSALHPPLASLTCEWWPMTLLQSVGVETAAHDWEVHMWGQTTDRVKACLQWFLSCVLGCLVGKVHTGWMFLQVSHRFHVELQDHVKMSLSRGGRCTNSPHERGQVFCKPFLPR